MQLNESTRPGGVSIDCAGILIERGERWKK